MDARQQLPFRAFLSNSKRYAIGFGSRLEPARDTVTTAVFVPVLDFCVLGGVAG